MTLGVKKLVGIILLITVSCGTKKKVLKKTQLETVTKSVTKTKTIKTDSSIIYLNISELKIVQKDSTQPIIIKDSKGNTTTFYNVKQITTKEDRSVLKSAINTSNVVTQTATAGTTITIDEQTKTKEPFEFNYWYILIPIFLYIILRKFFKTFFVWI